MKFFNLIPYYYKWHYTKAVGNILVVWGNYLWFTLNYFSLKNILTSFFRPYKKITEDNFYEKNEENKVVTLVMRGVGVVMRSCVLVVGLFALMLNLLFGFLLFISWFLLPIFLFIILIMGVVATIR
jgi:hypothetical protein